MALSIEVKPTQADLLALAKGYPLAFAQLREVILIRLLEEATGKLEAALPAPAEQPVGGIR